MRVLLVNGFIGLVCGGLVEGLAGWRKLWTYRRPWVAVLNIVGFYGVLMGTLASLATRHSVEFVFVAAFSAGLAYEVANVGVLHWWEFPGERLGFLRGHAAIVLVLAVAWGVLPLLIAVTHAVAIKGPASQPQSRLERLNEQETRLQAQLDAVHARQRNLEARLDYVRRQKGILLERRAVRRPGPDRPEPEATP